MFWPRCGPFGQFGGVRVVRGWTVGGEGLSRASSWLEIYDVTVELGETGAPRRVPGARTFVYKHERLGFPTHLLGLGKFLLSRQLGVDDYGSENRRREQALSCENGNVWRILIHSDFVEKSFLHTDFVRC